MTETAAPGAATKSEQTPVLSARHLVKHFPIRGGGLIRRRIGEVQAVSDVSFDIYPRETLALVGESGCGKSTTARVVLNLQPLTSGEVRYDGTKLTDLSGKDMQRLRRSMQIVFQDPYASLNPRLPIGEIIGEGLANMGVRDRLAKIRAVQIGAVEIAVTCLHEAVRVETVGIRRVR